MANSLSLVDTAADEIVDSVKPLTVFRIALAVFLGMWGFSITVGIVYLIVRAMI